MTIFSSRRTTTLSGSDTTSCLGKDASKFQGQHEETRFMAGPVGSMNSLHHLSVDEDNSRL